jgi:aminoglycoside 6'-N-acetyltransferase
MSMTMHPLTTADLGLMGEWLRRPHVAAWWREESDPATVAAAYEPLIDGSDPTEGFVVLHEGRPLGFIQRYRLDDNPEWQQIVAVGVDEDDLNGAGIDYLIGDESMTGRGLGRQMIAQLVADTWERYADIAAVVVAVQQGNPPSWRALEGAGFRRTWAGMLDSDDPSDEGPSYLYVQRRPEG